MGGIELRDGILVVDRELNDLDDLALRFSTILDELDVDHVFVSGYVVILAGRSRATEAIDVLIERVDEETVSRIVDRLADDGLWGPAMPLESMNEMLSEGEHLGRSRG